MAKAKISVKSKKTGKEIGDQQDLTDTERLWVNDYKTDSKGMVKKGEGERRAKQFLSTGDAKFFKHTTKGK